MMNVGKVLTCLPFLLLMINWGLSCKQLRDEVSYHQIDLDFDDSIGELPDLEKQDVIDEVLATTWEADDADDLVEEITSITG